MAAEMLFVWVECVGRVRACVRVEEYLAVVCVDGWDGTSRCSPGRKIL